MLKRIKKEERLAELAFQEIKNYIVEAKLKPGDRLSSEAQLAQQLGCGKSSVREALRSLEMLGIIRIVHGSGAIVNRFNFDVIFENLPYHLQVSTHDLQDLFEIREAFEVYFLSKAIQRIDAKKISQLGQLVDKMQEAAEQGKNFGKEDFAFHQLLFRSLHNNAALKLMQVFWNFLFKSRHITPDSIEPLTLVENHRRIINAVKKRDSREAQKAMEEHFSEIRKKLEGNKGTKK